MKRNIYAALVVFYFFVFSIAQAVITYELEPLLQYEPTQKSFIPASFWESMRWQRDETEEDFRQDEYVQKVQRNYERFCQQVSHQDDSAVSAQYSIPPIIHHIWLGSAVPDKVAKAFASWTKYHPGWEVKVWTDKDIQEFSWSHEKMAVAFQQATSWAEKADILRIEILYQFGGIYSDADVVCFASFKDLIVQDIGFFSCFELNYIGKHYGKPFFVGSAVMGASKGSHVMKYCLEHIQSAQEAPNTSIIHRTGPGLISRACESVLKEESEQILILPCSYLYPLPWKQRDVTSQSVISYISPESLAIHLWDGSWCTHKKNK